MRLFDDGLKAVEQFTGWPCFGVIPWLKAAGRLPPEDSVVLERLTRSSGGALKVAVPVLSRIANFDDLDPLAQEPEIDLVFVRAGERLPADAGPRGHSRLQIHHCRLVDFRARAGTAISKAMCGAEAG